MGSSPIDPVVLGVLVLAVALSQGFRGLVDRVASKAYAVPLAADMAGRHEYYRSAVALTQRQGRSPRHDPELVRLRAELELDDATAFALERSADMANDGPLIIGQLVGARYQILRALGRGGSGRVFLARDELLQRDVALKEVPIEGGDEAALWEARLAGSIHHPNVVSVYDVLQRPGTWVLVTEHVESGSLADRIARPPQLETSEAIMILDGILAGLAAVHEKGMIHRDLKPGNVLLASTGQPKLADFGIAGRGDDHTVDLASGRPTFGTPGYASPEQSRGERSRVASDIYAVGMIGQAILPSPLPLHIAPIIECALDEDPAARWPDARSMRDALLVASTVPVTS
jgi:serine/threonine protein kinase